MFSEGFGILLRPKSENTPENLSYECRRCKAVYIAAESLRQKDGTDLAIDIIL